MAKAEQRSQRKRFKPNTSLVVALLLFLTIVFAVVLGPIVWNKDPTTMDFGMMLFGPSAAAPFGADDLGRDVLSRVLHGGRTSLMVGVQVMLVTTIIGTLLGLLTAFGRTIDEILMRLMDVFMSFPALLLALAILASLGNKPSSVVIALSLVYIPRTARVVRGQVLSITERTYVEASRALGSKKWRTLLLQVLPALLPTLIVEETFLFAYAILGEAGLSFVGVGIQPPNPSWGNILGDARVLIREAPWLIIFPGLALSLTVLSLNLLGDGLHKALDPSRRAS